MKCALDAFEQVRIINLIERTDRRREMTEQLERIGAAGNANISFFDAVRPTDKGGFPSLGARGCFMSHLGILREALAGGVHSLLVIEDDFNFSDDFAVRARSQIDRLSTVDWDIFYGAYRLYEPSTAPDFGEPLPPEAGVETTPFVAFNGPVISRTVTFLEAMLRRPAGSPEYGPMHVDGAYSTFRMLNPDVVTYASQVQLGYQRSSRSDISDTQPFFDRIPALRPLADFARRLARK